MPPVNNETSAIDFRVYIGMLFFRWQTIVVCFLYCLLGGVLYLNLAPKKYSAFCKIMIYRDPKLMIPGQQDNWSLSSHIYLLQSTKLRERVVDRLKEKWGEIVGTHSKMLLPVSAGRTSSYGPSLYVGVRGENSIYAGEFLATLIEEHKKEWSGIQMESSDTAAEKLREELDRLEDKIRSAEEEVIEFRRLYDITRLEARASMESAYLGALVARRSQLSTELMLQENQYPFLKDATVGVISDVEELNRESGGVEPIHEVAEEGEASLGIEINDLLPESLKKAETVKLPEHEVIWSALRVQLARLKQEDRKLGENLTADHPSRRDLRKQIEKVENDLEVAAEVAMQRLRDRHNALRFHLNAVEQAEYKWQAKDLQASQRRGELNRIASVVSRYEANYAQLYGRLHDMLLSEELQAEHFTVVEPVATSGGPIWPDPTKILIVSVALGLGSGFGLAILAQLVDNKIQSIKDVEDVLGVPFLGGVPYWAHSGLERTIRPIVTEEHSAGAIEAYRALRTSLLAALNKMNEKIALVTSADSREGKTLTTLNMAIMIAQMGRKVLLVDMDLRRGRLHRSLGMEKSPGVADALKEGGSLREVIRTSRIENLDLAPTGSSSENSAELLQSADLVSFFVDVQDDYDYILVDTSPVLRVTDTVILATEGLGVVLYVARVNHTPKPLIRYSLDMLKDARIVGLIMNSIEMHKISSLYYAYQYPNYAYYSNAYSYGYNYYDYGNHIGKRRRPKRRRGGKGVGGVAQKVRDTLLPME